MMKFTLTLTALLLAWAPIVAGESLPEPNWELAGAASAAETPEAHDTLHAQLVAAHGAHHVGREFVFLVELQELVLG